MHTEEWCIQKEVHRGLNYHHKKAALSSGSTGVSPGKKGDQLPGDGSSITDSVAGLVQNRERSHKKVIKFIPQLFSIG